MDEERTVELTDPQAMRVLAHPTRLALLGELRVGGPASVGALGRAVDEAPGSVSYHLSRLAEIGLVAEAPEHASDRRQSWWRAVHTMTRTTPSADRADPERALAATALRTTFVRRLAELQEAYVRAEQTLPLEWVEAATSGDSTLHLTPAELSELSSELEELRTRWAARSDGGRDDARATVLLFASFLRPGALP